LYGQQCALTTIYNPWLGENSGWTVECFSMDGGVFYNEVSNAFADAVSVEVAGGLLYIATDTPITDPNPGKICV
jgi:hypothetical protein